jgi:hypothetical protein
MERVSIITVNFHIQRYFVSLPMIDLRIRQLRCRQTTVVNLILPLLKRNNCPSICKFRGPNCVHTILILKYYIKLMFKVY